MEVVCGKIDNLSANLL